MFSAPGMEASNCEGARVESLERVSLSGLLQGFYDMGAFRRRIGFPFLARSLLDGPLNEGPLTHAMHAPSAIALQKKLCKSSLELSKPCGPTVPNPKP